ncbi:MAG: hypothetical protein JXA54_09880 [Candidatus Heimdallarchaeota archaeon]|nr:hypothetical protein [Candidatus Heimdallarchaeota archaeon]
MGKNFIREKLLLILTKDFNTDREHQKQVGRQSIGWELPAKKRLVADLLIRAKL